MARMARVLVLHFSMVLGTVLLVVSLCCTPFSLRAETTETFSIFFDHAGLSQISVHDNQLIYTWHTTRLADEGTVGPATQSLRELESFRTWLEKHPISHFKQPFQLRSSAQSYGSAFETSITVAQGHSSQTIHWNGDNEVPPDLQKAVHELTGLADSIEKRRNQR